MPTKRTFAPSLAATLATLVMVPLLSSLGVWQLHRAQEKRALAELAAAGERNTVELTAVSLPQLNRYQRVKVQGRYESKRQILLDNMPSQSGAPGYRVLTPFMLADAHMILVDRGWVPLGRSRAELPDIDLPDNAAPVTIAGTVDRVPQPGVRLGTPEIGNTWPQVLSFPRYEDLQRIYGPMLLESIVLLDRAEPFGFERSRPQAQSGFGPERHVGYAVQWFGLALTVLIIYVAVNLKRRSGDDRA